MSLTNCKECNHQISKNAKTCPQCGAKNGSSHKLLKIILLIFIIGGVLGSLQNSKEQVELDKRAGIKNFDPIDKVELAFAWRKIGLDNIMEADFEITNDNPIAIKDIEIRCTHYAKSGTRIDSNDRTIFDSVPAHSSKRFMKFSMGFIHEQVNESRCGVVSVKT